MNEVLDVGDDVAKSVANDGPQYQQNGDYDQSYQNEN